MDDQSDAARALSVSIQRFDQTGELWGKQVLETKDQKQRPATVDKILGYVKGEGWWGCSGWRGLGEREGDSRRFHAERGRGRCGGKGGKGG
jgi:hypothetical protein